MYSSRCPGIHSRIVDESLDLKHERVDLKHEYSQKSSVQDMEMLEESPRENCFVYLFTAKSYDHLSLLWSYLCWESTDALSSSPGGL